MERLNGYTPKKDFEIKPLKAFKRTPGEDLFVLVFPTKDNPFAALVLRIKPTKQANNPDIALGTTNGEIVHFGGGTSACLIKNLDRFPKLKSKLEENPEEHAPKITRAKEEKSDKYRYALRKCVKDIFVSSTDSDYTKAKKRSKDFYFEEKGIGNIENALRDIGPMVITREWLEDPDHFEDLAMLIVKHYDLLRGKIAEEELRVALFAGAEAKIAELRNYEARFKLFGKAWLPDNSSPTRKEVKDKIYGLKLFQKTLLGKWGI